MSDWGARAARLVDEIQRGSCIAWEELFKLCFPQIQGFLRYLVGSLQDADIDDLSQEVMAAAFKKLHQLKKRDKFQFWLMAIARNKCWNLVHQKIPEVPLEPDEPIRSNKPDPEQLLQQTERITALMRCIEELTDKQKEVLILHHFHKLKAKEIAGLLDKAIGTVLATLKQTRDRLKDCCQRLLQAR